MASEQVAFSLFLPYGQALNGIGHGSRSPAVPLGQGKKNRRRSMRLAMYSFDAGAPRSALIVDGRVHDIGAHLPAAPSAMPALLEAMDRLRPALERLAQTNDGQVSHEVRLASPIPRPGKILALGLNSRDHATDAGMDLPAYQTWFAKMPTAGQRALRRDPPAARIRKTRLRSGARGSHRPAPASCIARGRAVPSPATAWPTT